MSDFRQQVRDHYDSQSLSPEKAQALLMAGHIAAAGEPTVAFPERKRWTRYLGAVAAVLLLAFTGVWWMQRDKGDVPYAALPPRVVQFFANKEELVPAPQDKKEVRDWLLAKGAPAGLEIPAPLLALESAACQVVDVNGRKAYMSCYWLEKKEGRGITELVHLLVSRADDFRDQPQSGKPVVREIQGWTFGSWTKGDIIYTLATAAPGEKLAPLLSSSGGPGAKIRYISSIEFSMK